MNLKRIKYSIRFTTLIPINTIKFTTLNLINVKYSNIYKKFKKIKLFIKESYLLLAWIFYNKKGEKKYFVGPKRVKKFTQTKSPMAHKTFSQEQFK